jgi:hypothetical protein
MFLVTCTKLKSNFDIKVMAHITWNQHWTIPIGLFGLFCVEHFSSHGITTNKQQATEFLCTKAVP